MADSDRYPRRTFTLDPDTDALLERLATESGKGYSELVCLGLLSLVGDRRMLRHVLAQPLNGIRLNANLLATMRGADAEPVMQVINENFKRIEALLEPPKLKT